MTQISGFRLLIRLLIRMTLSWGLTSPSILRQFHLLYMQIIYLRWNKPNCQVLNLVCNILCQFDCLNIYIALITKRSGLYWTLKVCFSGWVPSKRVWGTCKILFFMIYLWVSTEIFYFSSNFDVFFPLNWWVTMASGSYSIPANFLYLIWFFRFKLDCSKICTGANPFQLAARVSCFAWHSPSCHWLP